jgi:putative transposase
MDWAGVVGKITGSVNEHLLQRNEYLLAENRVLRSRLEKRPRFTDAERITLGRAAKPLGRATLAEIATLVSPDTLLRWHRRLVEKKTATPRDEKIGRPKTAREVADLVLQLAGENHTWGYDRIAGALKELGHTISDAAVGNTLKENSVPPAPARKKGTTWADFIATHKDVLVGCDFFTKEVWTLTGLVTYYVLFFLHVGSRRLHVAGFTRHPDETWVKQIA